jgi:TIR domain-containing protein
MPTIIVSYRRSDSKWITGRIVDRLERDYGKDDVFVDIDAIPLGMDFRDHLRNVLDRCDVLLAIIGPNWLATDESGSARILDPTDWVRIEIETALAKGIAVIPVLIDRAPMPTVSDLPESLHAFAFRQAADLDTGRDFHVHMDRLARAISKSAVTQGQIARPPEPAAPERLIQTSTAPVDEKSSDTPSGQPNESKRRRGVIAAVVAAACVAAVAVMFTQEWPERPAVIKSAPTEPTAPSQDRTPRESTDTPVPPNSIEFPKVARAVLSEENQNDPNGPRFNGQAIWWVDKMSSSPGQLATLAATADIVIPDRKVKLAFSLRRNTDPNLPASHTIELSFFLPPGFAYGEISNVVAIVMKQSEQTRGVRLAGIPVRVSRDRDSFRFGLSAVDSDHARNIQMLKERAWFDVTFVYGNNKRAALAIEKGASGERVFKEVFASWNQ